MASPPRVVAATKLYAKAVPGPVQSEDRPSQRLLCVLRGTDVGATGDSVRNRRGWGVDQRGPYP